MYLVSNRKENRNTKRRIHVTCQKQAKEHAGKTQKAEEACVFMS